MAVATGNPTWTEITTEAELLDLVGKPTPRVANKARPALHELDRRWLAASPFCLIATADAEGRCDVSPKGDPAGRLVSVVDDRTIVIAERPGNRRVDGYRNVLTNPHVGLIFLIPGRNDTLRINGRARLVRDVGPDPAADTPAADTPAADAPAVDPGAGPAFEELVVRGHRPILALVVEIDEIFHHCAKAFLRSSLWSPQTWTDPLPSRAAIAHELEQPEAELADLEEYYGPAYATKLYG